MFKKRLKEISKKLGENQVKEFHILTHKKHRREIYFQNEKKAIKFMKSKFDSPLKKIIYSLIKLNLLQLFLKKINLSSNFGEVIFRGNQIKGFDLNKKIVSSFPGLKRGSKLFIESKRLQKRVAEKGFAPKIFEIKIKKKFPYTKEELLEEYCGGNDIDVFKKLLEYYRLEEVKKVTLKKYISSLRKKMKKNKQKIPFIEKTLNRLDKIYHGNIELKITKIHGSFTKEQILIKDRSYIFTDWVGGEDIIVEDLIKFFKYETNLINNKDFNKILRIFPKDVKKNIDLYIILYDINFIVKRNSVINLSRKRINDLLR